MGARRGKRGALRAFEVTLSCFIKHHLICTFSLSSFYDDDIPFSEREFMTEDFNFELPAPHPGPISRTYGKYKRFKAKAAELEDDDPWTKDAKRLRRAEISAYWSNFLEKRRAIKALSRLQAAELQDFEDIREEADYLCKNEIVDKKLDRGYYYNQQGDPGPYVSYQIQFSKLNFSLTMKFETKQVFVLYRSYFQD